MTTVTAETSEDSTAQYAPGWNGRLPAVYGNWDSIGITLREKRMMRFIGEVTDKPDWERKVFDDGIVKKWRDNTHSERLEPYDDVFLSDKMFDFCIRELRDKAHISKELGRVHILDAEITIVKSDTAVPEPTRDALRYATYDLRVLGYVNNLHPEKHRGLYGVLEDIVATTIPMWEECLSGFRRAPRIDLISYDFDDPWTFPEGLKYRIPGGKGAKSWYDPITDTVGGDENAGDDSGDNLGNAKEDAKKDNIMGEGKGKDCDGDDSKHHCDCEKYCDCESDCNCEGGCECGCDCEGDCECGCNGEYEDHDNVYSDDEDEYDYEEWRDSWDYESWAIDHQILRQPEPRKYIPRAVLERDNKTIKFVDAYPEGLQIVFKLANIHLTPEKPKYEGGTWHIEGALHERICASAVYYYDQENIGKSHLSFRQPMVTGYEDGMMHGPAEDSNAFPTFLGLDTGEDSVQGLGSVLTRKGRLLVFPNCIQHRVQRFSLEDKAKPGYQKMLAMFLIDPTRRVHSTSTVPPQRRDWWAEEIRMQHPFRELPREIFDHIVGLVDDFPISWEKAVEARQVLMQEREVERRGINDYLSTNVFGF